MYMCVCVCACVRGVWCVVRDVWCVVCGAWCSVRGCLILVAAPRGAVAVAVAVARVSVAVAVSVARGGGGGGGGAGRDGGACVLVFCMFEGRMGCGTSGTVWARVRYGDVQCGVVVWYAVWLWDREGGMCSGPLHPARLSEWK